MKELLIDQCLTQKVHRCRVIEDNIIIRIQKKNVNRPIDHIIYIYIQYIHTHIHTHNIEENQRTIYQNIHGDIPFNNRFHYFIGPDYTF